ncbi:GNAT family protein [Streptomyces sp. TG1A-60]|uniref:GNAT family N-acetyltransferase n=1 Tax=Streptomyces sp. TG1A-60 TaxID=3129111 RepID=UPI0030CCDE69
MAAPAHPSCAAGARHTAARLAHGERSPVPDDAVFATGGLPTNAVRRANADPADTAGVTLECSERQPRGTLADPPPAPPRPRAADSGAGSGCGLSFAAASADDCGTDPPEPEGRSTWGRGYATEAARAEVGYGFGDLGLAEIPAVTTAANLRSQAVMRRLGMTRDPADDFDDPSVPTGPLRRNVVFRLAPRAS